VQAIMRGMTRNLPARLLVAATLAAAGAACDRTPPTQPPPRPTADQLAATPNAVGIPYDRYVVIRSGERLIALHVTALSPLGDRVSYRWYLGDGDGRFARPEALERGEGEAVERPHTGHIALPGPLTLSWSRGSTGFGWLYWPDAVGDFAVYSRPFARLADADPDREEGRWLTRDMFRR